MKLKFAVMLAPALALGVLAVSAEAQLHRATRLGNPATRFAKKVPKKPDDVRVLLRGDKTKADVVSVLNEVGWKGNLEDFDRAAAAAEITEVQIAPGTRLPFMASRAKSKPHALQDVLWAGSKPIDAYALEFASGCVRYRVVVPKACGNFWIEEQGKDSTGACAPPPPPPVVSVATAGEACVTQPVEITVNVQNPPADNKVAVSVDGKQLIAGTLTRGTFKANFPGSTKPGVHEVTATSGGVTGRASVTVKPCIPTCGITVTPNPVKAGRPVTVDVTGSRVATGVSGGVKSAKLEVIEKGAVVNTYELTAPNFTRNDVVIKNSGVHTLRATVTDEAGQASTNTCQADVDVKSAFPFFAGVYGGKERLFRDAYPGGRCAGLLGAEVGVQPKLGDNAEFEAAVGVKLNLRDSDNTSIFGDVALNYLLAHGFFGGGLTAWDLTKSDTRSVGLLVQGGFDLTQDGKWQLVGQARAPFNHMGDIDSNYQVWGGFRFRPSSSK